MARKIDRKTVTDVYVRRSSRGPYTLYASEVGLVKAYRMVDLLRRDEDVVWAYCTDPRPPSLDSAAKVPTRAARADTGTTAGTATSSAARQ